MKDRGDDLTDQPLEAVTSHPSSSSPDAQETWSEVGDDLETERDEAPDVTVRDVETDEGQETSGANSRNGHSVAEQNWNEVAAESAPEPAPAGTEGNLVSDHGEAADTSFEVPSNWEGAVGGEPPLQPPGTTVEDIKAQAVDLKPKDLPIGEYSGGGSYENDPDRGQLLPEVTPDGDPITYTEYDCKPYDGIWRNGPRFVVGSDGTHYATTDHYQSFWRFR